MTSPTTREPFILGQASIPVGTRDTIDVPVSSLADHTPVTMPVHVVHGHEPGPTVFVSSGLHGDEITGIEVVRRLMQVGDLDSLKGTLLVVPIVNALGFFNRSRYLPDRRDLNRSFPGSPGGSLAARLAHLFTTQIVARSDVGIDLHSAAVHRTNLPQVRISPKNPAMHDLARVFGAPAIVRSAIRPGSIRATAADRGVPVLLYEAGEALRYDEVSARVGVVGVLRILKHQGMIEGRDVPEPKTAPLLCTDSTWVRSPASGLQRSYCSEGDVVQAGDVLGVVSDPFGHAEQDIVAPEAGLVIGRAVCPVVHEGDAMYHLANLEDLHDAEAAVDDLTSLPGADDLFDEDQIV